MTMLQGHGPRSSSEPAAVSGTSWTLPPDLDRVFRLVVFDWDGTAVVSRQSDATRVGRSMAALLAAGTRLAVVTGTHLGNVLRQVGPFLEAPATRRLVVSTNRGSEVFGFDRKNRPVVLWTRKASEDEERKLTRVVDEVRARLSRLTGLEFGVVYDRLNRRKLDLIPEPAWADPPKSAIGQLLAATEARLRGAGLFGGLREAFEITERVARELGLEGARVTSDVKHIEIGLTDKRDAISYVLSEIALPLGIEPGDVLLVGDEFGPLGGFEGSDFKMLDVAWRSGAVVVSVGPEPGGAPDGVVHLGGGPDRFCQLLEHQDRLGDRLGPLLPPRDAAWVVQESGFDLAREHEIESMLAVSNGYVGSRASIPEGTSVSRPATFLAGAFEPSSDVTRVPELVILPDWGRLRLSIENTQIRVERGDLLGHRRILDLKRGLLLRQGKVRLPTGHVADLLTLHAPSLAEPHVLVEAVEVVPENFTGVVCVDALLTGEVRSGSGAAHWASFDAHVDERGATLVGRTHRGLVVSLCSGVEVHAPRASIPPVVRAAGTTWASERCEMPVRMGSATRLFRTVTVYSSRDHLSPRAAAEDLRERVHARPAAELIEAHERAWAERWAHADVEIEGAPRLERALRFAAYHLIAAANPSDPRCSVGARALTGEAYKGHVFWDTDVFLSPFYSHCYPSAARAMLDYRHNTLNGAREKAKKGGWEGALYAWESADTGEETTPSLILSPYGEIVRVLSGEQEQHIAADVAFAVDRYERVTGDMEFGSAGGLEILVETARFWASRVELDDAGVAHVRKVIGPDEYHETIDDNAFTNWMAAENLLRAARAVERSVRSRSEASREVLSRIRLRSDEPARWRNVAARMARMQHADTGLIEQFAGFFSLDRIELLSLEPRTAPVDALLGRARTQRTQVVKQSDVVQLVAMLWDRLGPRARLVNFLEYEPLTAHGSSLSPGIHAMVAARLGLSDTAERYLEQTAAIDLDNHMGNAAGGVHIAAMGSLWQAVVQGVAGMRLPCPPLEPLADRESEDADVLVLSPRLLPRWRGLAFKSGFRGARLDVVIEPGTIEVEVSDGAAPFVLRLGDGAAARPELEVRARPGKRYVAKLGQGAERGFEGAAWEETSA